MIMRWLIRLAFPALGLLLLLIFFGINDPQKLVSSPSADSANKGIPAFEGQVPSPIPDSGPSVIFKWQDSSGGWHYADSPPQRGQWNALTVKPSPRSSSSLSQPPADWQAPYHAPFSMDPAAAGKDS